MRITRHLSCGLEDQLTALPSRCLIQTSLLRFLDDFGASGPRESSIAALPGRSSRPGATPFGWCSYPRITVDDPLQEFARRSADEGFNEP
jgi:hypothetical protein